MKRYDKRCAMDDNELGHYVSYAEAAARMAEKDKEIARWERSYADLLNTDVAAKVICGQENVILLLQEQLRASNEAKLPMAQRLLELENHLGMMMCELSKSNEALIAAEAMVTLIKRTVLHEFNSYAVPIPARIAKIIGCKDNLTALAEHDKEVGAKAAEIEREACANVCECDESGRDSGGYFAERIRERSNAEHVEEW